MPLGIELAASWVRTMNCRQIARALSHDRALLTTASRSVPTRQQNIQRVFDYVWTQLPNRERDILMRLAVFSGSFTLEAALSVTEASRIELVALRDKVVVQTSSASRLELHALLRQAMYERLLQFPALKAHTDTLYAAYYAGWLATQKEAVQQEQALAAIDEELPNLRAMWQWAVEQGAVDMLDQAVWSLNRYYYRRGLIQEGVALFSTAVAALQDRPVTANALIVAKILRSWGRLLWVGGMYAAAEEVLEQGVTIAHYVHNSLLEAQCLFLLGHIARERGQFACAEERYQAALRCARQAGAGLEESIALHGLGMICYDQGYYDRSNAYYEQDRAICREMGNDHGEIGAIGNLGVNYSKLGALEQARDCFEQAVRDFNQVQELPVAVRMLGNLGLLLCLQGNHLQAWHTCEQAVETVRRIDYPELLGSNLTKLGHVYCERGMYRAAGDAYREALQLHQQASQPHFVVENLAGLARLSLRQGDISQALLYTADIRSYLQQNGPYGPEEPFRLYLVCYQVLQACEHPDAGAVLNEAYQQLQHCADRIADSVLRESFLYRLPYHRELLQIWETATVVTGPTTEVRYD